MFQNQKIKEEIRKEFYVRLKETEIDCHNYTDSKHNDLKDELKEIKTMIAKLQDILIGCQRLQMFNSNNDK